MPVDLAWELHGVVRTHVGDVHSSEMRHSVMEMIAETAFDSARYLIVDLRQAGKLDVKLEDLEWMNMTRIASYAVNPEMRVAIVVTNRLKAWIGQQLCYLDNAALGKKFCTKVFHDIDEARAWAMRNGTDFPDVP